MRPRKKLNARDRLAASFSAEGVERVIYNNLSPCAKETLVGQVAPVEPARNAPREERDAYQIAAAKFDCLVDAHVRYMLADTLLQVGSNAAR